MLAKTNNNNIQKNTEEKIKFAFYNQEKTTENLEKLNSNLACNKTASANSTSTQENSRPTIGACGR